METTHSITTMVMGATTNPERYANKAIHMLREYGYTVYAFGQKPGTVADISISQQLPESGIDTVTLYLGPRNQEVYHEYILKLKPRRVIFNPGTEHPDFQELCMQNGIRPVIACTLVLLKTENYDKA